jgi:YidC/Oxa1 family membrane protein insertase
MPVLGSALHIASPFSVPSAASLSSSVVGPTGFGRALGRLAGVLHPVCGASATAAAIVVLTVAVRLALHPLARAAVRGEMARAALAPRVAALRKRYGRDSARLARALSDLYATEGASPFAGLVPMLVQVPVFMLMYRTFSGSGAGLHRHALLGAPLGANWPAALAHGGPFGGRGTVYLGLFAVIAAVAAWNVRRARRRAAAPISEVPGAGWVGRYGPLLSFTTLVTAALLPLATGLYLATTAAWSAAERAWLYRSGDGPGGASGEGPQEGGGGGGGTGPGRRRGALRGSGVHRMIRGLRERHR